MPSKSLLWRIQLKGSIASCEQCKNIAFFFSHVLKRWKWVADPHSLFIILCLYQFRWFCNIVAVSYKIIFAKCSVLSNCLDSRLSYSVGSCVSAHIECIHWNYFWTKFSLNIKWTFVCNCIRRGALLLIAVFIRIKI